MLRPKTTEMKKSKHSMKKSNKAIKIVKSDEVLIIMGDWNAKMGSDPVSGVIGRYGLGEQNERGQRLQQFGLENPQMIS